MDMGRARRKVDAAAERRRRREAVLDASIVYCLVGPIDLILEGSKLISQRYRLIGRVEEASYHSKLRSKRVEMVLFSVSFYEKIIEKCRFRRHK